MELLKKLNESFIIDETDQQKIDDLIYSSETYDKIEVSTKDEKEGITKLYIVVCKID